MPPTPLLPHLPSQPWFSLLAAAPVTVLAWAGMNLPRPPWNLSPILLWGAAAVGLAGVWLLDGRLLIVAAGLLALQQLPWPGERGFQVLAGLALLLSLGLLFVDWRLPCTLLVIGLVLLTTLYLAYHDPEDRRWFGSWTGPLIGFAVLYPHYTIAASVVRLLAPLR